MNLTRFPYRTEEKEEEEEEEEEGKGKRKEASKPSHQQLSHPAVKIVESSSDDKPLIHISKADNQ